jgi:hypothetical protein
MGRHGKRTGQFTMLGHVMKPQIILPTKFSRAELAAILVFGVNL